MIKPILPCFLTRPRFTQRGLRFNANFLMELFPLPACVPPLVGFHLNIHIRPHHFGCANYFHKVILTGGSARYFSSAVSMETKGTSATRNLSPFSLGFSFSPRQTQSLMVIFQLRQAATCAATYKSPSLLSYTERSISSERRRD